MSEVLKKVITAEEFAAALGLELLCGRGTAFELVTRDINRPGLQLTGMGAGFDKGRVQVLGPSEMEYICSLKEAEKRQMLTVYFKQDFPCVVLSRALEPDGTLLEFADDSGIPLFRGDCTTSALCNRIADFLAIFLAHEEQIHGVLMDVNGVGVLLKGKSGVGKSEIALELVAHGHRLASDDAVIIKRIGDRIIGYAPPVVRHFSEVRGIGLIDVVSLFGAEAAKLEQQIELVIELENWNEKKEYERVGRDTEKEYLLGVPLVKMTIPVSPGRNVAVIVEIAASVYRQRMMGFIAAEELERRLGKGKK